MRTMGMVAKLIQPATANHAMSLAGWLQSQGFCSQMPSKRTLLTASGMTKRPKTAFGSSFESKEESFGLARWHTNAGHSAREHEKSSREPESDAEPEETDNDCGDLKEAEVQYLYHADQAKQ